MTTNTQSARVLSPDELQAMYAVTNEALYSDDKVGAVRDPITRRIIQSEDGRDDALNVHFSIEPVFSRLETYLNGSPTYVDQEFVTISAPGGGVNLVVHQPVTDAMTPEQAAAFSAANRQYANLIAVQNMVRASSDTGVVTPRQMINAVKSGRFKNAFYSGDAPYQDLAGTAAELYGPAGGRGLGSVLAKAINGGAEYGVTAAVVNPTLGVPAMVMRKLAASALSRMAASDNPTVVKLLAGGKGVDPVVSQYIARALAGSGALTGVD